MNKKKRKFRYDRLAILILLLAFSILLMVGFIKIIIRGIDALLPDGKMPKDIAVLDDYSNLLPNSGVQASTESEAEYFPKPLIYDDFSEHSNALR